MSETPAFPPLYYPLALEPAPADPYPLELLPPEPPAQPAGVQAGFLNFLRPGNPLIALFT